MELNAKELDHLKRVIDYLYSDEARDYENEGQPADHIFISVLGLQEILWRGSPRTVGQPTPEPIVSQVEKQSVGHPPANTSDLHLVTD